MDTAGVHHCTVTHLKAKAENLNDNDKICVILFDSMELEANVTYNAEADQIDGFQDLGTEGGRSQKFADEALVFMLQGISKKINQPIAHYLVGEPIETEQLVVIIKTVIRAMTTAGYKIIATVCDHGPTNVKALNSLKMLSQLPVESHYFLLDNEKIFTIFDVPHLLISIRNNFIEARELAMDDKIAKWQHIIDFEELNRTTLQLKNITKSHVNLNKNSKGKVELAAQLLSNTVAGMLKLQSEGIENAEQSNEVLQTALVVELLDRLFDSTNGPDSREDIKENIRDYVSRNSFHHQIWPEYKQKLKTLTFLKSDSQIRFRCVNGYIITISSLQDIWNILDSKDFKRLNLRQLNLDALENFFETLRRKCSKKRNPTTHQFISALKSSIRHGKPKRRALNCDEDDIDCNLT